MTGHTVIAVVIVCVAELLTGAIGTRARREPVQGSVSVRQPLEAVDDGGAPHTKLTVQCHGPALFE
jgi:hypothetical protein